jgi:DNA-binding XRE family transcriptional regulator
MSAVCPIKIKQLRIDNGWTQDQLAQITGLSYRTIQRIEKSGRCSLESKMALSSAFNITFLDLTSKETTLSSRSFCLRFVQDGAGNYKSLQTNAPDSLPVPQQEIVGKNCADILPYYLSNQILTAIDDLKSGVKSIEFDYQLALSAGPKFFKAKMIQANKNSFLSVITEISEEKVVENRLIKSESLLSMVADTLKTGAWEFDLVTNDIYWTQQVFAIYELTKTPTIEEGISFYAPQARPIIQQAFEKLYTSGETYDLELPFISATGKKLWVRVVGWAKFHNARIIKVSGIIQDITHLKTLTSQPGF